MNDLFGAILSLLLIILAFLIIGVGAELILVCLKAADWTRYIVLPTLFILSFPIGAMLTERIIKRLKKSP